MVLKAVFGVIGMGLVLAFLGSILFKLQQLALAVVILIGVAMMAYDFWQSLQEKDDS